MLWKFRYLIPAGASRLREGFGRKSRAVVLSVARSRWKFIEVLSRGYYNSMRESRARCEPAKFPRKSRRGNNSGDGKTAGRSFRFRRREPSLSSLFLAVAWAIRYHSDGQFKVTIRRPFSHPRGKWLALRFEVPEMRFDGYYRIDWLFPLMEVLTCEFLRYAFSPGTSPEMSL